MSLYEQQIATYHCHCRYRPIYSRRAEVTEEVTLSEVTEEVTVLVVYKGGGCAHLAPTHALSSLLYSALSLIECELTTARSIYNSSGLQIRVL